MTKLTKRQKVNMTNEALFKERYRLAVGELHTAAEKVRKTLKPLLMATARRIGVADFSQLRITARKLGISPRQLGLSGKQLGIQRQRSKRARVGAIPFIDD